MAADSLKQVVEKEKAAQEATKKKRAEEKRAEEDLKKKSDAVKEAALLAPTISQINTVVEIVAATKGMTIELDELLLTPTSETTKKEEDKSPEHHGINPNQLSYVAATAHNNGTKPTINSPVKKKIRTQAQ
jgi:hypothetical protein